jgi:arsenate reductase
MTQNILFLCTHNSARSQMAEGLLRTFGGASVQVYSAGTVATQVRPEAIQVMAEIDIDISDHRSKVLDQFISMPFDAVITVCDSANQACPFFPNAARRLHWSIADPSGVEGSEAQRLAAFRDARDDLLSRIKTELLPQLSVTA